MGPVLGPHARTDRTRNTPVAEPWLPAPEMGRPGEGQRLTPDAPHNGVRPTPPGDGPPPPPRHAAPTGHAGQGDSAEPPHPHTRAHSTWVADSNSPPSGRAVGGGTAPDLRRPSQWWKAPPLGTPFRQPHREQRRPARVQAVGPVMGPHARTDRTRDTRVAEPWLPAPEDGRPGEGQRLTPDVPQNSGRPPPPRTAPHHPRGTQPPQGMQAKGTVLGPHTHTRAPTARGWRTPTARPVGGQSGEGQRLTSDAPVNGGRQPPRGRPSATPTASNAGPQGRTLWGWCWVPKPAPTAPGHTGRGTLAARSRGRAAGGGTAPDTRRPSQRWQAVPPEDGPPPPPGHEAPTEHAGQGDSVGHPHPHTRAHSTWVADPNSPPSGRAVGGGTAPDLRRPSQWWKAPPPGKPFRQPHSERRRPARAHAVGSVLGHHARTNRTRDTGVVKPWLPAPEGGRPGEGQHLTPGAPHNGGRPPPLGTAPHHPRCTQPPQGMQAKGTVLGPHTLTPAFTARGWRTPAARPVGGQSGEGQRLTSDAPHTMVDSTPPGDALLPPPQRATPARKGACRCACAGSPRPHRPHPGQTGRGSPAARSRGRATGGGTAPDTRRPSQRWQATPPGDDPPPPPRHAAPTGHAGQGDSVGPPHPHTRAHNTWVADSNSPRSGRAVGGGTAPDLRRPSQWWKAPPPGTPFRHPHSEQPRLARAHAVGPVLGPHAGTDRTQDTRVAEPWPPAPEDGRPGEGQRLTPDAPQNSGRQPPRGTPFRHPQSEQRRSARAHAVGLVLGPHARNNRTRDTRVAEPWLPAPEDGRPGEGQRLTLGAPHNGGRPSPPRTAPHHPRGTQPPQGMQAKGTVLGPHTHTPAPTARGWQTPTARPVGGQSGEGQRLTSDAPHNGGRRPPRGRPSASPTASDAGPQGRTLWGRCWVPTPAPTAPGTHG